MTTGVPPLPRGEAKPTRIPIYLSALVLPGAGQLAQRRWIAGLLYGGFFLVFFIAFMVCVIRIFVAFYSLAFSFDAYRDDDVINIPKAATILSFLAALATYAASLIDTFLAYQRQCTAWSKRKIKFPEP